MKKFNYESPIMAASAFMVDIVILNVLWLLCSIPIVTIGTSTSALYYCMLKIVRKEDSSVTGMFFHAFRQNLRQGCILTVILLVAAMFLYVDIQGCRMMGNTTGSVLKIVLMVLFVLLGAVFSYVFPILAQFENSTKNILKCAYFMSIMNFGKTVIMVICNAIPLVLFFGMPYAFILSVPVWLLFGMAVIALLNSKLLVGVFDRYIEEAKETTEGMPKNEITAAK